MPDRPRRRSPKPKRGSIVPWLLLVGLPLLLVLVGGIVWMSLSSAWAAQKEQDSRLWGRWHCDVAGQPGATLGFDIREGKATLSGRNAKGGSIAGDSTWRVASRAKDRMVVRATSESSGKTHERTFDFKSDNEMTWTVTARDTKEANSHRFRRVGARP
ncbi:MAG: hypothetical protein K2W96_06105 [Gemmataceae bacterium]|nr:hypothetical protein [Gemmataceae bacterium]